jgi:hypothetical protein
MLTTHILNTIGDAILAAPPDPTTAPAPDAGPGSGIIDSPGVVKFLMVWVAPIFCAVLGIIFLARAKNGEVGKVVTSSGIAIAGFVFLAGAFLLPTVGPHIVDLFIPTK